MPNLIIGIILGYVIAVTGFSKITPAVPEPLPVATVEAPTVAEIETVAKTADQDGKEEKLYKVSFTYATLQDHDPVEFLKDSFLKSMKKGDSTYGWEVDSVDNE